MFLVAGEGPGPGRGPEGTPKGSVPVLPGLGRRGWSQASGVGTLITGELLSGWHLELNGNTWQKGRTSHPGLLGLWDPPPPHQEARARSKASWEKVPATDTWTVDGTKKHRGELGSRESPQRRIKGPGAASAPAEGGTTQGQAPSLPQDTQLGGCGAGFKLGSV